MNITKKLDTIRKKYRLALILAHGSQVSHQTHPQSDLDIAILPQNPHQTINFINLINDLSQIFPNQHIDLVNLAKTNPLLLKRVADQCQLLSGSQQNLAKFQLQAFHRYNDYLPYFKLEQQHILNSL